jgi:hypothetical protein
MPWVVKHLNAARALCARLDYFLCVLVDRVGSLSSRDMVVRRARPALWKGTMVLIECVPIC